MCGASSVNLFVQSARLVDAFPTQRIPWYAGLDTYNTAVRVRVTWSPPPPPPPPTPNIGDKYLCVQTHTGKTIAIDTKLGPSV